MEPKGLGLFSHILLIHPPLSWAIRACSFRLYICSVRAIQDDAWRLSKTHKDTFNWMDTATYKQLWHYTNSSRSPYGRWRVKNYSSSLSRDQRNEREIHKTRLPANYCPWAASHQPNARLPEALIADRYYPWSNSNDGNSIVKATRPRLGREHVYRYDQALSESLHRAVHRVRRYSLFG